MHATGKVTRRQVLVGTALSGIIVAAPRLRAETAMNPPPPLPKRKNIDALTSTELDNYKHAVGILKQRSVTNPTVQDGYVYQARLHNIIRAHPDGSAGAWQEAQSRALCETPSRLV